MTDPLRKSQDVTGYHISKTRAPLSRREASQGESRAYECISVSVAREVFNFVKIPKHLSGAEALPRVHVGSHDSSLDGAASGQMSPVLRARLRFHHDILHALRCRLRGTFQALRSSTIDTQGGIHF